MALPYSFGTATLNDQNFYKQLQADLDSLSATGRVVSSASATYATNASLATVIPADDTIPQDTEGTQILSVPITPHSASNTLRIMGHGWGIKNDAGNVAYAVFRSGQANAIQAGNWYGTADLNNYQGFSFTIDDAPATTSSVTYSVRVGPSSGNGIWLNGSAGARVFGGVSKAVLVVQEIAG